MHVVMIGAGDPPPTFIRRQIEALAALGVRVSNLPEPRRHRYARVRLCRAGFVFQLPRAARELARSADVLHYQWPGHLISYYALAARYRRPAVLSLRGRQVTIQPHLPGQDQYVRRLRKLLPQCAAYHCVSGDIQREGQAFGLNPVRSRVIRTGVDVSFFRPQGAAPSEHGAPCIAMIGALIWRKGYEYALLALRRLVDRGAAVRLEIAGDGPERDRIACAIEDLRLAEHVRLRGRLTAFELRELLWTSRFLLHASLSEGIANVLIEAMACGVPVVTTDTGGAREAVTHGLEGLVVPPLQPEAMSEAMGELLERADLRARLGAQARERAVRDFDQTKQARLWLDLYEAARQR